MYQVQCDLLSDHSTVASSSADISSQLPILFSVWILWCAGKCLTTGFPEEKRKLQYVTFAHSHGINAPTMAKDSSLILLQMVLGQATHNLVSNRVTSCSILLFVVLPTT